MALGKSAKQRDKIFVAAGNTVSKQLAAYVSWLHPAALCPTRAQHAADLICGADACAGSGPHINISMAQRPWPSNSTKVMHTASRASSQQTGCSITCAEHLTSHS